MAAIALTARKVSPLKGAICRPYTLAGDVNVGDAVVVNSAGKIVQADADASGTAHARGILVSVGTEGETAGVSGDRGSVAVFGPVAIAPTSDLTIAGLVYNSVTAGSMDQTASATTGKYPSIIGWAEAADVVFVNPQTAAPTANS